MATANIKLPISLGANDISAGIVVFLVALPLCLGAAVASGAPLGSGLISSIVAGLIVTWISGSTVTVTAPATGLALLVLYSIQVVGSFEAVLVAVVIAGLLQILLGTLRAGAFASFFPHSVIKGMLAAVGLLMILKEFPHVLGWDANFQGDESFGADSTAIGGNTFTDILNAFSGAKIGAVIISLVTFLVFVLWSYKLVSRNRLLSKLPAALVAIVAGTVCHELMIKFSPGMALTPDAGHFISMPLIDLRTFFEQQKSPDWTALDNSAMWKCALLIAIFSSVETLLTVEAADKFTPKHQMSNLNRELIAQGIGNTICGLIGGLPIAAGIIRSTANIYAGARGRLSSFIQALLLIVAIMLPDLMNRIPIAAFATLIIIIASNLIRREFIREVYAEGIEQFLPFIITIVAIALTDLLTGVAIGLVAGWIIVIRMNHHSAITVVSDGPDILVRFSKDVTFAHKLSFKKILLELPQNTRVLIDGTGAHFIDHDILDVVSDFRDIAPGRNIELQLKNLRSKRMSIMGVMDGKLQEPFAGK